MPNKNLCAANPKVKHVPKGKKNPADFHWNDIAKDKLNIL